MSLGTQGRSASLGMTGLRINSNSNGSGRGYPLYIWVDSGCGPIHLGRWTAGGGCPYMSLGTQGPSASLGMTGLRINSKINGSGQGCPLYIWVDSGKRPDTPGPLDSRGRLSPHGQQQIPPLRFAQGRNDNTNLVTNDS